MLGRIKVNFIMSFCNLFFFEWQFCSINVKLELFGMLKLHLGPQIHFSLCYYFAVIFLTKLIS